MSWTDVLSSRLEMDKQYKASPQRILWTTRLRRQRCNFRWVSLKTHRIFLLMWKRCLGFIACFDFPSSSFLFIHCRPQAGKAWFRTWFGVNERDRVSFSCGYKDYSWLCHMKDMHTDLVSSISDPSSLLSHFLSKPPSNSLLTPTLFV